MTLSESITLENRLRQYQQFFIALYRRESGSDLTAVPSEGGISSFNLTGYPLIATEKLTVLNKGQTESDSPLSESKATVAADTLRLLTHLAGEKE